MTSLQKLCSVTLTYFSKVNDLNRDLPTVANAHTSVTSSSKDLNRDLPTVANAHTSVTSASKDSNRNLPTVANTHKSVTSVSTAVLRVGHKLTHSSKRPFKCDECEFKCDEGDTLQFAVCQRFRCPFLSKV